MESVKFKLEEEINNLEAEIEAQKSAQEVTIPNIDEYQIEYLNLIRFFDRKREEYNLISFIGDSKNQLVKIEGAPNDVDLVQNEILSLLPKIKQSRVTLEMAPILQTLVKTDIGSQIIKDKLLEGEIPAAWTCDETTMSIYSESKSTSMRAKDFITEMSWNGEYPAGGDLDAPEKKLVMSAQWKNQMAVWTGKYQPIEIEVASDNSKLLLAGLQTRKKDVLEDIQSFFDSNAERERVFLGEASRILFLQKFKKEALKDLEASCHVKLTITDSQDSIHIAGIRVNVDNCEKSLRKMHDAICISTFTVQNRAMIEYLNHEDEELVKNASLKMDCLIVPHKESTPNDLGDQRVSHHDSVQLPNGTVCVVQKTDITDLSCDAVVNAANGKLQHVGGLAAALVNKGTIS